jgi:glycosyltransferase involved in cell wall biosynthesis
MEMILKKISIITPSLNRAEMLELAIQSVIGQAYSNFEHIIVDGGSTDGTLDLIKKYDHLRLISGHDQGMYDALNKGLDLATGEIVSFLNTDDFYGENVFRSITGLFEKEDVLAVAGSAIVFANTADGNRKIINQYSAVNTDLMECSTIGSNYFNAWFFRRSVFSIIGKFDINYRVAGDREFMLRFALAGLKYEAVDQLTYQYRQHSNSLTFDDNINKRRDSAADHLRMTDVYLRDVKVPKPVKTLLKQLRTRVTLEMAIRYMKARDFDKVLYYMAAGIQNDLLWPVWFWRVLFSNKKYERG